MRDLHKRSNPRGNSNQPQVCVGDVVIIKDEKIPRGFWRLGTVDSLMSGKDGKVRAALMRTHTKDGKSAYLRHPVEAVST